MLLHVQAVMVAIPSTNHGFALHLVLLARLLRFTRVARLMKVSSRLHIEIWKDDSSTSKAAKVLAKPMPKSYRTLDLPEQLHILTSTISEGKVWDPVKVHVVKLEPVCTLAMPFCIFIGPGVLQVLACTDGIQASWQ